MTRLTDSLNLLQRHAHLPYISINHSRLLKPPTLVPLLLLIHNPLPKILKVMSSQGQSRELHASLARRYAILLTLFRWRILQTSCFGLFSYRFAHAACRSCTSETCLMRRHTRSCVSWQIPLDVWCSPSSMSDQTGTKPLLNSQTNPQLWPCVITSTAMPILQRQVNDMTLGTSEGNAC